MHPDRNAPESHERTKRIVNVIAAVILTTLGIWLAQADFSYHGDLLFQSSLAGIVNVLFVALFFLVSIVTAVFPKRVVITVNLLMLSHCALGFPLNVWLGNTVASRIVSVGLLVLSIGYFCISLRRIKWPIKRSWLQWRHSIIVTGVWLLMVLITLPVWLTGYVYGARNLLGKYTSISAKGVNLTEAVFEKNGQKVHLVGMMHIGDGDYYSDLKKRINATPPDGEKRLVLTEGVSDKDHIIPEGFANGKTYDRWAKMLGIEAQKSLKTSKPRSADSLSDKNSPGSHVVWQNADMDVSELSEKHRKLLVQLLTLASSGDITQMLSAGPGNVSGEEIEDLFMNGLLHTRNNALMKRFDEMGAGFQEIYIPWGAAHLPDIEKRLLALGYRKTSEVTRLVLTFWK